MTKSRLGGLLRSGGLWAMFLSGLSILLALLREVLIVQQLGFSGINDALQSYLTMIHAISLLNEAVRLSALNILQSAKFRQAAKIILPYGAIFSILATGMMYFLLEAQSVWLTIGAGISGFLNMVMILMVTGKQRGGSFWKPHLINLLPNAVLLPGILLVGIINPADPVIPLASLYYTLPVIQIILLLMVKSEDTHQELESNPSEGRKILAAHSSSAFGNLIFQGVLRNLSMSLGSGELTKVSIAIRVFDAMRFVFVDTIIGRRLKAWTDSSNLMVAKAWLSKLLAPQVILSTIGLLIAIMQPGIRGSLIILVLCVPSFGLRMVYFMLNSSTFNRKLAWHYGAQDIAAAVILAMSVFYQVVSVAWLIWLWYSLKPLGQMIAVKRFLTGLESNQKVTS